VETEARLPDSFYGALARCDAYAALSAHDKAWSGEAAVRVEGLLTPNRHARA
jgi:hypothetical protein